jgi:hypothetical protein
MRTQLVLTSCSIRDAAAAELAQQPQPPASAAAPDAAGPAAMPAPAAGAGRGPPERRSLLECTQAANSLQPSHSSPPSCAASDGSVQAPAAAHGDAEAAAAPDEDADMAQVLVRLCAHAQQIRCRLR